MSENWYQFGFSKMHHDEMYDEKMRSVKARKTLSVLDDYLLKHGKETARLDMLDIGCSTGFMTKLYAQRFRKVTGIDIDKEAVFFAGAHNSGPNIRYLVSDCLRTGFDSGSFDVISCTQIYEHVPDAMQLMNEMGRLLKTDGICYFAAGNRLNLVEGHYGLPLLSIMPRTLGHMYLRITGKGRYYYEKHLTLVGLRRLAKRFKIIDYTRKIIEDPAYYNATDMLVPGSVGHKIAMAVVKVAYFLCPTYIWILEKTDSEKVRGRAKYMNAEGRK
jgi:2-polyprenyl-3-methyl-5-hydroxy-6-metoxy-1,4-benzoquinol methylase